MPPYTENTSTIRSRHETADEEESSKSIPQEKQKIVWIMVVYFTYLTIAGLYGLYLCVTAALWKTIAFTFVMNILTSLSITAGAHRLWTHKAYKARMPLQILLMLLHSATNTHPTIKWVRDHLLHHKYTDTDADPHDSTRGFFYCHIGYLLLTKTVECRAKGKSLDLSELYANPVLRFQQKNCVWLIASMAFIIPTLVPLLWNEAFTVAFHMNILRVFLVTNFSFMVNSFAHMYGTRPYDKTILPTQNKIVSFFALGEGFHNYHHAFPNDYRTAELGDNYLNPTTKFIDFCVWIGQAYDCNYVSDDMIEARIRRTGERKHKETVFDKCQNKKFN